MAGAIVDADSLPSELIKWGVVRFLPTILLLRLPPAVLLTVVSISPRCAPLFARRYEAFMTLACCTEAVNSFAFELAAYAYTGLLVEFPINVCILHIIFMLVAHIHGPVRLKWNAWMWASKLTSQLGLVTFFPAVWHRTWAHNSSVWLMTAVYCTCVATAPANDRRLRRAWASERAKALSAKKLA